MFEIVEMFGGPWRIRTSNQRIMSQRFRICEEMQNLATDYIYYRL